MEPDPDFRRLGRRFERLVGSEPYVEHGAGVDDRQIDAAVRVLGELPDDYRQFLRTFGWLRVRHYSLRGLGTDVPFELDLVAMTLDERDNFGFPAHLIALENDGGGNQFAFDGSLPKADSGPVLLWVHDPGPHEQNPYEVAPSFHEWMIERLTM